MPSLDHVVVLIVDPSLKWGQDLRARLVDLGAKVHTVNSFQSGIELARIEHPAVALVGHCCGESAEAFRSALGECGTSVLFTAAPIETRHAVEWETGALDEIETIITQEYYPPARVDAEPH